MSKWKLTFLFSIISFIFLSGCVSVAVDKKVECSAINSNFCEKDSDCVCGGKDIIASGCFFGNVQYYEKCVDKTKECPDFCGGITGNLQIKCENNKCVQQ